MRYERAELLNAFKALTFNEKPTLALIGALVGVLPTTIFVALMSQYLVASLLVSAVVYPIIVALFSRYVAKLHTAGARIPVTLVVGAAFVILGVVFQFEKLWLLLTPVPLGIVYIFSDIKLSRIDLYAVDEHIIRPFTIEIPSHSKLLFAPIPFTVVFAILCNLVSVKMNQGCLSDIANEDHSVVLLNCASYAGDTNDLNSTTEHKFGSYFEPTKEAKLIQAKAESGNAEFQYIWWFILEKVYRNEFSVTRRVGKERYESKADSWLNSAADGGSVEAMKAYITQHLNRLLSSEHQKELALKYAKELDLKGLPEAKRLLEKAGNKITRQDVLSLYTAQLKEPESLSLDELKNLLHSLQEGDYFYNLKDFDKDASNSRNTRNSIDVPIDTQKALNVLKVMSEKYQNAEASFRIFNLLEETNDQGSLSYLRKAAEQGHVIAAGQLGEHLFCSEERLDGLSWLTKAAKLGNKKAKRQRDEIASTKQLIDCSL